ncbi:hypothetical protein JB92DRAFT_3224434 [Gautieria morchelliformis]|nr:hypothetical protein JB92DRAFT_3224434 [Gautieria morchelliformis]
MACPLMNMAMGVMCLDRQSCLHCNQAMHSEWEIQAPALVSAYLYWKHNKTKATQPLLALVDLQEPQFDNGTRDVVQTADKYFQVTVIDLKAQGPDELTNVSLLRASLLGSTPNDPSIAITLDALERQSGFSVQAMCKVLCVVHNVTYSPHFRIQLSNTFDVYLDLLRHVSLLVNQALGRDGADWHLLNACLPCSYRVEDETPLIPARLQEMDGNMSLKHINGAGHTDERVFHSDYHILPSQVDRFKDDVGQRPGKAMASKNGIKTTINKAPLYGNDKTLCTENWVAANAIYEETVKVFEQTGGFVCACRHGFVQTFVEMWKSGELAKYGLATLEKILKVFQEDQCVGSDIACSFMATVHNSSLSEDAHNKQLTMALNAFNGHAHGRLSNFMYNNYKQALSIINEYIPEVEAFKSAHGYTDEGFISWHDEEFTYLSNSGKEPPEDALKVAYVEALQKLDQQNERWGSMTTVQWLEYTPPVWHHQAPFQLQKNLSTLRKLELAMNVVEDIERRLGLNKRWTHEHPAYQEAAAYINNQHFTRVVEQLEGLVVARLFELAKANLMGTCYKMRKHISKAITRRSVAVHTALDKYNLLAPMQNPPRPRLEYRDVAGYGMLADFELLKQSRHYITEKAWSIPANRLVASKYFKMVRAREEIQCLNIEICRMHTWVQDEDRQLKNTYQRLSSTQPELATELLSLFHARSHVNNIHRARLRAIYELPGFTGVSMPGVKLGHMEVHDPSTTVNPSMPEESVMIEVLEAEQDMEVGDDDQANDEVLRLGEFLESTQI